LIFNFARKIKNIWDMGKIGIVNVFPNNQIFLEKYPLLCVCHVRFSHIVVNENGIPANVSILPPCCTQGIAGLSAMSTPQISQFLPASHVVGNMFGGMYTVILCTVIHQPPENACAMPRKLWKYHKLHMTSAHRNISPLFRDVS
jgi:hypothetical protein